MENKLIFTDNEIKLIIKSIYFALDNNMLPNSFEETEDLFDLVGRIEENE